MSGAFGSKGFTPENTEGQSSVLNNMLMSNMTNPGTAEQGYENWLAQTGGKTFMGIDMSKQAWEDMSPQERAGYINTAVPIESPSKSFTYKPGESGYDMQSKYKATNFKNEAEPYYGGILNQANEATKMGMQSGMDSAMGMAGRRGLGRSGVAQGMLGNVADSASRQMATNASNIGFQRAQDYNTLNQASDASRRAAEQYRQQGLTGQATIDQAIRGEKMNYYNTPIQQMMQLYGANMGAPGNQARSGWLSPLMGGIGSTLTGIGSL